jgi:hypothetical protein
VPLMASITLFWGGGVCVVCMLEGGGGGISMVILRYKIRDV